MTQLLRSQYKPPTIHYAVIRSSSESPKQVLKERESSFAGRQQQT